MMAFGFISMMDKKSMSWLAWEALKLGFSVSWYSVYYTATTVVWIWSLNSDSNVGKRLADLEDQVWLMSQQDRWLNVPEPCSMEPDDPTSHVEGYGERPKTHDEHSPHPLAHLCEPLASEEVVEEVHWEVQELASGESDDA